MKKELIRISNLIYNQPWLIQPSQHDVIRTLFEKHINGESIIATTEKENEFEDISNYYEILGNTAIFNIAGTILGKASNLEMLCGAFSCEKFRHELREVAGNPEIKNIILSFDTPGGTVIGTPETAELIYDISQIKNVISYTDGLCCSAGYWLASQANQVFASTSAIVGSVGVYSVLLDYSRALDREGITANVIQSGKFKTAGIQFKPLTDDERKSIQDEINTIHEDFKNDIIKKRKGMDFEDFEGQTFSGKQALTRGFIDGIVNDFALLIDKTMEEK